MSGAGAAAGDEDSERLIHAVLAAQVAALRDRIELNTTVELLWETSDVLAQLAGLIAEQPQQGVRDPALESQCAVAVANVATISGKLEELAFLQSQHQDFARQVADCVVTALERLAGADAAAGDRLRPGDLRALYVCEEQRVVHDAVARQFPAASIDRTAVSPVQQDGGQAGNGTVGQ